MVGIDQGDGAELTVSLWATNLLDEEYLLDALPFNTFAYETQVFGQPRSWTGSWVSLLRELFTPLGDRNKKGRPWRPQIADKPRYFYWGLLF